MVHSYYDPFATMLQDIIWFKIRILSFCISNVSPCHARLQVAKARETVQRIVDVGAMTGCRSPLVYTLNSSDPLSRPCAKTFVGGGTFMKGCYMAIKMYPENKYVKSLIQKGSRGSTDSRWILIQSKLFDFPFVTEHLSSTSCELSIQLVGSFIARNQLASNVLDLMDITQGSIVL